MHSDLEILLELQGKDAVAMAVEEELRSLEPQIGELDRVIADLDEGLAATKTRLEEACTRRDELETMIEAYKVMQDRRRQKLEWVRGAKEASSLMAEIDLARGVLAKEESEWVRSSDGVKEIEQAAAETELKVAAAKEEQGPRREELAKLQGEYEGRLKTARAARSRKAKAVRRELLVVYDRVCQGRAPLAMYEIHSDACGHCFTSVPMHLRQQIQRGDTVATCEACGVIMFVK